MNEKRRACAPYQFFGAPWTAAVPAKMPHTANQAATCAGARRLRSLSVTSVPSASVPGRQSSRLPTGHMPRAPVLPCLRRSTLSAALCR
jgi:hypothetical protein